MTNTWRNPSQEERNEFAIKLIRAWYRMLFTARMTSADVHPGNYLFMGDGTLGLLDFGFMLTHDDVEWEMIRRMDRAMTTGRREDRIASVKEWSSISDDPADADRLRLNEAYADWTWRCRYVNGPFDFGDEADFRRGIDIFSEMVRKRYSRSRATTPVVARQYLRIALDALSPQSQDRDPPNRRRGGPGDGVGPEHVCLSDFQTREGGDSCVLQGHFCNGRLQASLYGKLAWRRFLLSQVE